MDIGKHELHFNDGEKEILIAAIEHYMDDFTSPASTCRPDVDIIDLWTRLLRTSKQLELVLTGTDGREIS